MGNRWIIYFLAVPMAFLCGSGDGESSGREECEQQKSEGQVHIEAAPTSAVTNEVAMAVAEIEKAFATIPSVVTNWVDARKAAYCIREKICRLPSELSERYGHKMVQKILSVPIDHLRPYAQFRACVTMFYMLDEVGWRDIKEKDVWDLRIQCLYCLRGGIERARKGSNDLRERHHVAYMSDSLNWYSETWEKRLVYRESKAISPAQHACDVKTFPDKEYFAIRKRFEDFLGRPIRPYEEIVRAQREHERQLKRERLEPNADEVKVEVDGL